MRGSFFARTAWTGNAFRVNSRFVFLSLAFALFTASSIFAQDIRITEFEAINTSGIMDEDGSFQPWIELWNTSTTTERR